MVKQLQARYERTKDLQADFTQKTTIGGSTAHQSSGKVYIKKPGRCGGIISTLRSRTSMSIGMISSVCAGAQTSVGRKLTQMAASKAPLELLQGAAKLEESFDMSRHRGRDVAWEESGYSPSCLSRVKVGREFVTTDRARSVSQDLFHSDESLYEVSGNVASLISSLQST